MEIEEFARVTQIFGRGLGEAWERYQKWLAEQPPVVEAKRYEELKAAHDRALEMLGNGMMAEVTKERAALPASTEDLDAMLVVLRQHGVAEFTKDQFGIRVKFEPKGRALVELQDVIGEQLKKYALDDANLLDPDAPPVPKATTPREAADGVMAPQRYDLDDVLPGAK
jgi:hypothetical protein